MNKWTVKKITIVGKDYKELLLKYIDESSIPEFLGGRSKCDLSQN